MNKTIAGGLTAVLLTSGVGLTSAPVQASPASTTVSRAMAGPLPLDLCDVLPALCAADVSGPLLQGVDSALVDLLGTSATGTLAQVQQAVQSLVTAIGATLTGVNPADQPVVANAIASQLQGAGLVPAVLDQVVTALGLSGVSAPVTSVLATAQDLVGGLLGIGGQTPDPARVQELVSQLLQALAAGDTAALGNVVSGLLTSLPGGSALAPGTLTGLVGQVAAALQGAATGSGPSAGSVISGVTDALNSAAPAPSATASSTPTVSGPRGFATNRRPTLRGTGTAGASVTVRTSTGTVLGSTTVTSTGSFAVVSRKLKIALYRVTATQTARGLAASAASASRSFRVVSAKPVIKTKSGKKFKTHRPKITGIGYPKTKIVLRSSTGKKLGSTKVRTNGTWTIKSKKLSSGTKKLKVVQTGHNKKRTTKAKKIRIR